MIVLLCIPSRKFNSSLLVVSLEIKFFQYKFFLFIALSKPCLPPPNMNFFPSRLEAMLTQQSMKLEKAGLMLSRRSDINLTNASALRLSVQ